MDLIDILIFAGIAFFIARLGLAVLNALEIQQLTERVDLLKKLDEMIHQVKVETQGDMQYWFDAHDDQFLAQGRTENEIIEVLKARFPQHVFLNEKKAVSAKTNWELKPMEDFRTIMEIEK
jgi:hypothetical protein